MQKDLRPDPGRRDGQRRGIRAFFRNVGSLSISRAATVLSQLLALPLLARQLTLEDFALVAMAMTVAVLASALSDAGLGRSLIRRETYDETEWSSVFWLLAAVGTALAGAVVAAAPIAAWYFGQPELKTLIAALASVPLLNALAATPTAELERSGRFGIVAFLGLAGVLAGLAVAVALALAGAGAWALVAQQIVLSAWLFVAAFAASRFRPRLAFSWDELGDHIVFSRDTIWTSIVATIQSKAAVVALGPALGAQAVAIFTMAERFVRLPQQGLTWPLARVIYVDMAERRSDPAALANLYLTSMRLLSIAVIPPVAVLAAAGDAFFPLVLSDKWADVAVIFALLAPGIALEASAATGGSLFMAAGRTDLRLRMMIEKTLLWIVFLALSIPFGLAAAAAARSVLLVLYMPRYWRLTARCAPLTVAGCWAAVAPATAVGAAFWLLHELIVEVTEAGRIAEVALAAIEAPASLAVIAALSLKRLKKDIAVLQHGGSRDGR